MTDLDHVLSNLPESAARAVDIASAVKEMEMTCDTAAASDLPRLYQVETTSRCNLECPFCPRTTDLLANARRDLSAIMPLEKFEGILDSMPWLKSLELFHFGEPFLDPITGLANFLFDCPHLLFVGIACNQRSLDLGPVTVGG